MMNKFKAYNTKPQAAVVIGGQQPHAIKSEYASIIFLGPGMIISFEGKRPNAYMADLIPAAMIITALEWHSGI